jgi:pimeloyl-ACP methyl ester carboxylesterase
VRGESGEAPLLFLHGVAGGAWSWGPQAVALAQRRRTYAWEARGHGEAARVDDAGLAEYFDDALQALSYIVESERQRAIVVAHSLGGLLGLALAATRPSDVAGLYLVEPVYLAPWPLGALGPLTLFGPQMLPFILALAENFRYDTPFGRAHSRRIFESSFRDRDAMERAWEHQRLQKPVEYRRLLLELSGASTHFPLRRFGNSVAVPVRLLEGTNLIYGMHFPNLVEELQRRLGSAFTRRVISGGHYLQLDREADVTADLVEFAESVAFAR